MAYHPWPRHPNGRWPYDKYAILMMALLATRNQWFCIVRVSLPLSRPNQSYYLAVELVENLVTTDCLWANAHKMMPAGQSGRFMNQPSSSIDLFFFPFWKGRRCEAHRFRYENEWNQIVFSIFKLSNIIIIKYKTMINSPRRWQSEHRRTITNGNDECTEYRLDDQ